MGRKPVPRWRGKSPARAMINPEGDVAGGEKGSGPLGEHLTARRDGYGAGAAGVAKGLTILTPRMVRGLPKSSV
jgi:hypothetical protein